MKVKQPPVGVKLIAMLYFVGAAGYIVLLLAWLFARAPLISFIEEATPSATLGPTLLLDVPGVVTAYFVVLAALCCWVGVALQKLQRWAWFVSYGVAVLSFVLDIGLFVHMLRHLPIALLVLGVLRFGLLAWMVGYLTRTSIRAAFGLARVAAARV
ncbi:MAG TPA: hypothetical protein VJ453_11760 [Terriglobales bacterium]|nr:hypothetical protein [Terriglobales bacterium]